MKIHHIAIWTTQLEEMRNFYCTYFNGISNQKYVNQNKGFESYFIHFDDCASLELMKCADIDSRTEGEQLGYCHLAFSLGSKDSVLELTDRLRRDGCQIVGEPRVTGDGYFESVVLDIDGNRVELVSEDS
ncbi:VOC family protein [uncultured Bacteroides sp.]|uniref:VOC family protein n=1 Tax=uncultured Bacteroides sp. TaxID=162156 RepID=UPI002AAB8463|nr:VOC family protein [uncultured Bacteroides sp.]